MRITDVKYEMVNLKMAIPLKITYTSMADCPAVFVKISTDEGICGYGEAAPFAPVTGETEVSVLSVLKMFTPFLIGADPLDIAGIHAKMDTCIYGNGSAKCAVDIALYDIASKAAGLPLYRYLGGSSNTVVTDVTIGMDEPAVMAERAMEWIGRGFKILKLKTGSDPAADLDVIRRIRRAAGEDVLIRIDGNQGYTEQTLLAILPELAALGVMAVEQPLPYWDIDGLARLKASSGTVAIMADESLHDPHDALRLCRAKAADTLNIKLMKCGGIYPALAINAIAESFGVNCMVGCMAESKLAISAALALVAAKDNISEADCDSFLLIEDQGLEMKGGFTYSGCSIQLSETPGLGLDIDF